MPDTDQSAKIASLRDSYFEFLEYVVVNSKEYGAGMRLADHIYRAQHLLYETIFDALAEGIHNIVILKSRQLGISTAIRPLMAFWGGVHEGLQGAMVYDTPYNTARARREVVEIIKALPSRLAFPAILQDSREALLLEGSGPNGSGGSQFLWMAAGVKNARSGGGLGRSVGLNFAHRSEMSSWVNEEGIISFEQSLSETYRDRLYLEESTARGYEIFYRHWQKAQKNELGSRTLFLGWWSHDKQVIERGTADFAKYGAEPPTPSEIARMNSVYSLYGWRVTLEQLAWYRKKTDPSQEREEGDEEDSNLLQEQPWDENEAFQMTGSSFFQSDKLSEAAAWASAQPRPQAFRFIPGIDFVGCEVFPSRTRREIELKIWEEPVSDSTYVIAGDPAFGHNEHNNNSCAQVLRCFADGLDQVAEYATATIDPLQFSWLLWTLIGYYGSKPNTVIHDIIEINGPGEEVWRSFQATKIIVQQGYLRSRAREKGLGDIFTNVRDYIYQRSDSFHAGHAQQFRTNSQTKEALMTAFRDYWHNGILRVRSMDAIEEAKTITRDGATIGAEGRDRDDRVFALAMGVRAWHDKVRRGMVVGNRTREAERARLSVSIEDQYALWQKNTFDMWLNGKVAQRTMLARQAMGSRNRAPRRPAAARRF